MKKMTIILVMLTMAVMAMNAQSMAVQPQPTYTEPAVVVNEPNRAGESLRTATPVVYRATRPAANFSPLNELNYTPQKLYAPSQQKGYVSYGGGNAGAVASGVGSAPARVNVATQTFHSTSILLPTPDKDDKQLAQTTTAEQPLMQRAWGPGGNGHPLEPMPDAEVPVGNTPWLLMTLLAAIYIFFRK
ncbi:MAG: hypothetical protein J6P99_05180 [Paludibacteraceae bacterium]|nr:hypothetical protein [Paludibacteraceae bacterium]